MQLIQAKGPAITSKDIADLLGSRHDNVKASIDRLVGRGTIGFPAMQEIQTATKPVVAYVFSGERGKRDSIVVVAQLSPEFTAKLVDRWQELEAAQVPRVPQSLSEALRLAADQAEQIEQQQALIEQQKPAVAFVENYVQADGLMGFRQVAKLLGANERKFKQMLLDRDVMYYLGGSLTPKAQHIEAGRFEVKTGTGSNDHAFTQAKFTPKGVQWIAGLWAAESMQSLALTGQAG